MAASGDRQRKQNWWQKRTGAQQVAVVVALIGACAGILAAIINLQGGPTINVYAPSTSASSSPPVTATPNQTNYSHATITISQPRPGALVGPTPTISGSLANTAPDQYVWEFSQPYTTTAPYVPMSDIYPYEECSIYGGRTQFICPDAFNGYPNEDYCRYARLWVAVVNATDVSWLSVHRQQGMPIAWPNPPDHIDGGSASVPVRRYPESGTTKCVSS